MNKQLRGLAAAEGNPHRSALDGVMLGDVVILPDGRSLTVRSATALATPVAGVAGLVVVGELHAILAVPYDKGPVRLLLPVSYIPADIDAAVEHAQGEMSYLPPHAAATAGAVGALLWRMLVVPGRVDPLVLVYRSGEVVTFVPSGLVDGRHLRVVRLDRPTGPPAAVPARTAARVHGSAAQVTAREQQARPLPPAPPQ